MDLQFVIMSRKLLVVIESQYSRSNLYFIHGIGVRVNVYGWGTSIVGSDIPTTCRKSVKNKIFY